MKEKSLAVSGLMFLVSIQSFELLNEIMPNVLKTCDLAPRFTNSLLASVLSAAFLVSLGLSMYYFGQFGSQLREEKGIGH